MRKTIREIFLAAIEGVKPQNLIKGNIHIHNGRLRIMDKAFDLLKIKKIYVIGAGKASAAMAEAIEELLEDNIDDGVVIVKYGHTEPLKRIRQIEAGHPMPDENGVEGTLKLLELLEAIKDDDLIIALISGGGSSLLVDLPQNCTLEELQQTFDLLLKSGANVEEMNSIRKHLSRIKGGGLAKACYPATLISLILSDVINDPLNVIASGPTVPDSSTEQDVRKILDKYQLRVYLPASILRVLQNESKNENDRRKEKKDNTFDRTYNYIIGSNTIALNIAQKKAQALGFHTLIMANNLQGDAAEVARELTKKAKSIAVDENYPKPTCLLWGGETTVKVQGNGSGGRNQHLALSAAIELENCSNITLLSAGTDGTDGPTDAAGAIVDQSTIKRANTLGLNARDFLINNDSYNFFKNAGGHLITGPTKTNVMDVIIILIE